MISRRRTVAFFCTIAYACIACAAAAPASAADKGPGAFVNRLGEETIATLADVSLSPSARQQGFRELLKEGFAVKAISHFVLGKYRKVASEATLNEFTKVFEDYVVSTYGKQFKHYSGQKFNVEKVIDSSRSTDSMVMTKIISTGDAEPLLVNFQVRKIGDSFKILDIRVEGVSMVLAQRDEFTSYMAANGGRVESLISALRQRIADGTATAEK